jgi:membrane-associated phospholipid phosphatase
MTKRALACLAAIAAALALLSIFAFDRYIALAVHASGLENSAFFVDGRRLLDVASGRTLLGSHPSISGLLLGGVLLIIGILWWLARRSSFLARALAFTGSVQLATIGCGWLIKDAFGRMRPYLVIVHDSWNHIWFAGGDSFPSGHVAYFWGLFLPLAYLFPKYRIPLLIIPVYIAFARIDENVHFLSDVLGSIALAALVTLIAAAALGCWVQPAGQRHRFSR